MRSRHDDVLLSGELRAVEVLVRGVAAAEPAAEVVHHHGFRLRSGSRPPNVPEITRKALQRS